MDSRWGSGRNRFCASLPYRAQKDAYLVQRVQRNGEYQLRCYIRRREYGGERYCAKDRHLALSSKDLRRQDAPAPNQVKKQGKLKHYAANQEKAQDKGKRFLHGRHWSYDRLPE